MIAIDTNLLVYAHRPALPEHSRAIAALSEAFTLAGGWGVPFPCLGEFWNVVTRSSNRTPSPPHQAHAFLHNLWKAGAVPLQPRTGLTDRLTALAAERDARGSAIFDLQIALIAFEAGAHEIWTNDRDFAQIPGLRVKHPF